MPTGPDATGTLRDTYVAALQHDLVEVPEDAHLLGVVRRPTGWFSATVDENLPALGPPADLLDAVKDRQATLEAQGMGDAPAHNAAWDDVAFAERYRAHLETPEARTALGAVRERLAAGETVVLVCFEDTDVKRCHRTILRDRLEGDRAARASTEVDGTTDRRE